MLNGDARIKKGLSKLSDLAKCLFLYEVFSYLNIKDSEKLNNILEKARGLDFSSAKMQNAVNEITESGIMLACKISKTEYDFLNKERDGETLQ